MTKKQKNDKTPSRIKRIYMSETESDIVIDVYAETFHKNPVGTGEFTPHFVKFANAYILGYRAGKQKKR